MERNTAEEKAAATEVDKALLREKGKAVMAEVSVDTLMNMTTICREYLDLMDRMAQLPGVKLPKEVGIGLNKRHLNVQRTLALISDAGLKAMDKSGMLAQASEAMRRAAE